MSVQKEHYKPFSMTVNEKTLSAPIVVGIEKSNAHDISIDAEMYHLGDNSYSEHSANAGEFKTQCLGPFYTKKFVLRNINLSQPVYLVIGSIIGIDTLMARTMGQNHMPNSYASPPEIYFNGNKISEIQINGDGQKIKIPSNLVKKNQTNEVTIKTGRNLMQTSYIDYDDIEFMNLLRATGIVNDEQYASLTRRYRDIDLHDEVYIQENWKRITEEQKKATLGEKE